LFGFVKLGTTQSAMRFVPCASTRANHGAMPASAAFSM
jgi:hypothetical protein